MWGVSGAKRANRGGRGAAPLFRHSTRRGRGLLPLFLKNFAPALLQTRARAQNFRFADQFWWAIISFPIRPGPNASALSSADQMM